MVIDFYDAHLRHLDDAEILYAKHRWANADHLYGFAAECGLKWLMQKFGMDPNKMKKQDKKHLNGIIGQYETYRSGHYAGAKYVLPDSIKSFSDPKWDINQRYEHQSYCNQAYVDPHRTAALEIHNLVKKAQIDGSSS